MVRPARLLVVLATLAAWGCGGHDRPVLRSPECTGSAPADAVACPGTGALEADTPRSLVTSCAGAGACAYACADGFALSGGTCQPAGVCTGAVPEHATPCAASDQSPASDAPYVLVHGCDCEAGCTLSCAYACDAGYVLSSGACAPVAPVEDVTITDNGDGTVTVSDSVATRRWLRDARCLETLGGVERAAGVLPYLAALQWTGSLGAGACGLSDGSAPGDWQIPDDGALRLLAADLAAAGGAAEAAFLNLRPIAYWTTFSTCTGIYGIIELPSGLYSDVSWNEAHGVWPVRD
ncbi:MAG: hypothetical protein QM704_22260 [Anaeromyxobacteraceae bacterium]